MQSCKNARHDDLKKRGIRSGDVGLGILYTTSSGINARGGFIVLKKL